MMDDAAWWRRVVEQALRDLYGEDRIMAFEIDEDDPTKVTVRLRPNASEIRLTIGQHRDGTTVVEGGVRHA